MKKEQQLLHMLAALHIRIGKEDIEKEELQEWMHQLETLFIELSEEHQYNPHHRDEMFAILEQNAKEKLADLEEKVKQANPISFVQEQTKKIKDELREFWKEAGFNYISDMKVGSHGTVEVEFGFSFDYGLSTSREKVTKKEQIKITKDRLLSEGYVFSDKETELLDCDINKSNIEKLILERFPSAVIFSYETFTSGIKERKQIIRHLNVRIRDINEIINKQKEEINH